MLQENEFTSLDFELLKVVCAHRGKMHREEIVQYIFHKHPYKYDRSEILFRLERLSVNEGTFFAPIKNYLSFSPYIDAYSITGKGRTFLHNRSELESARKRAMISKWFWRIVPPVICSTLSGIISIYVSSNMR